jgi:hypothetical protein
MFFVHFSIKDNKEEISEEFKVDRLNRLKTFQESVNIPSAAIKSGE